jgi:hypothetical protein
MNIESTTETPASEPSQDRSTLRPLTCETGPEEHEAFAHERTVDELSAANIQVSEMGIYRTDTAQEF